MEEKHLEKDKIYIKKIMIFVDLEKAYDRVSRGIIWWALRKKDNVGEEYIKVIQDMYDGCTTSVRTLIGSTESFEVKVGLHQGSALGPLLFITVMDVISQECSAVECRTRNQVSPVSNPPLLPFRRLGIFVLSIDAPVDSAV